MNRQNECRWGCFLCSGLCRIGAWVFLALLLCRPLAGQTTSLADAEPPVDADPDQIPLSDDLVRETLARDLTNAIQNLEQAAQQPASLTDRQTNLELAVVAIAGIFLLAKLAPRKSAQLQTSFSPGAQAHEAALHAAEEDQAFSEFAASFRVGPGSPVVTPQNASCHARAADSQPLKNQQSVQRNPVEEFFEAAPKCLAALRSAISEVGRAGDEVARQQSLGEVARQIRSLKGMCGLPELLPVWQVSSALDGLLKQLTDSPTNVTFSTLRTVSGALDLLKTLCVRGLKPDLATNPPVRFLAVDDDPIIRHALSFSLKKAFTQPDLANNGPAGLLLAEEHTYDVIFLDTEMPGMNGYEVCSRIRQTVLNDSTPLVFVSCHSDFKARTTSALAGGQDFIAKPFLTFELAVKALTLTLSKRLQPARGGAGASLARLAADDTPAQKSSVADVSSPDVPAFDALVPTSPQPALVAVNA